MKNFAIAFLILVAVCAYAGNGASSTASISADSWQPFGLATDTVSVVCESPTGTILAGTFSKGIYRSTDHGTTWSPAAGPVGFRLNGIVYIKGAFWAGLELGGLYKSTDDGATWVRQTLPPVLPATVSVRKLATNQNEDLVFSAYDVPSDIGYGIGRSTDGGANWIGSTGLTELNVPDIVPSTTVPGLMFCAVKGSNGILKSTDYGASWSITSMTTAYRVYSLGCSPNGTLFAGTRIDPPNAPAANGIYRSTDNGATWSPVNNGVPSPSTLAVSGTIIFGVDGSVFVGTFGSGVLRSTDNGNSWSSFSDGLPAPIVASLANGKNGVVFAAGLGIYSTSITTGISTEPTTAPSQFVLSQNYPNPFNPETGLRFQVPGVSDVKLAVYDQLGREVAVLVNETKAAGSYEVKFNGAGLVSGVYYYRLIAGNFTQTRTMMLVK